MNEFINTSRRNFLYGLGASLGTAAFNALLQAEDAPHSEGPLAPRPQHHPAKAKACIMLYMAGGPSHIDLFEPKPELEKLHMKEFVRKDKFQSAMASGKRYFIKSPYKFIPRRRKRVCGCATSGSICPRLRTNCATTMVARRNRSTTRPPITT